MIAIWRVNMRIFGNADDLPEEIEVKINALIKKIESISKTFNKDVDGKFRIE